MARAQFEYDEVGNTFYYVIVSFFAVILFPLTHFLWPSLPKRPDVPKRGCRCDGDLVKRFKKEQIKPWEKAKCAMKGLVLLILWILFILLAYKVSQLETQHEEYDPYKILDLDQDADVTEIKKKYRELSKTHHPDRGGDPVTFDAMVKAYKALTDEESRENWRLYGNPDGPKATTFGIALPKWIVSEQYGGWVLGLYTLVFMVILPVGVGLWWYNSIKYSADKVLLETTRLYCYFLQKTPSMEINRIIMIVAGSYEFWKKYNNEIVERESDDKEIPRVMRELRNLGENKKEPPLCYPWSIKARTLVHAYLTRVDLQSERLMADQNYMISRSLLLMEEFLRLLLQMMHWPMQRTPTIDSLENALRVFPMLVQALWPRNSNLLQLPHLSEPNVAYLRKHRVLTCQDLARLNEYKRRSLLNTTTSEQYEDIIHVLVMMPRLEVDTRIEVQGEDDKETVTVGSVVTLKVTLRRFPLLDMDRRREEIAEGKERGMMLQQQQLEGGGGGMGEKEAGTREEEDDQQQQGGGKRKVWEKQPKKGKGKKGGGKQQTQKSKKPAQKAAQPLQQSNANAAALVNSAGDSPRSSTDQNQKEKVNKSGVKLAAGNNKKSEENNNSEEDNDSDSASSNGDEEERAGDSDEAAANASDQESNSSPVREGGQAGDDQEDWEGEDSDELMAKKDMLLESEPTTHHEVHCPHFPGDKFEWWYIYLVERKTRKFVTMVPCKTLDQEKTLDLRFPAPAAKGSYFYTLHIKSDSYLDFDQSVDVKMEVHPARDPPQVKYEDTEEEDEEKELESTEDDYTEGSDSEQEE